MKTAKVENIVFTFEPTVEPFQYEAGGAVVAGWPEGSKVVDVVAHSLPNPPSVTWLLEVKDFRLITQPPRRSNLADLAETVAAKVRQTRAALPGVATAAPDAAVRAHATQASAVTRWRVVLHLESHPAHGAHAALFPASYAVNVLLKLRSLLPDIDSNPLVLDIRSTANAPVLWTAA